MQEEPVQCGEYRALLDAMSREMGERTGYSFIKDNVDTDPQVRMVRIASERSQVLITYLLINVSIQTIQRSAYFIELVDRYGGELKILNIVKGKSVSL